MDERSTHFTIRLRNDRAAKLEELVVAYGGNRSRTIAALVDAADLNAIRGKKNTGAVDSEARRTSVSAPTN